MSRFNILIADDEERMRRLVKDFLTAAGYGVIDAENGEEAMNLAADLQPDLIILDVMMPVMDGFEACRRIRQKSEVPIIMLTARGDESDELRGFDGGADEYISKPFSPKILVARVEALLRRSKGMRSEKIEVGEITLDTLAHEVMVKDMPIELTYKEFELLTYFVDNKGIALSREKILNSVWSYDYFGDARTIDSHITKLRSKLGNAGRYIHTVRGIGYKFEVAE